MSHLSGVVSIPSSVRRASGRLSNVAWERRLGVSTRGICPIDHPDSVHYATIGFADVNRVLQRLELGESDVFVDIGSGKGRVLCCAARYSLRQVVGVDLSPELCEDARVNAAKMRGRKASIQV